MDVETALLALIDQRRGHWVQLCFRIGQWWPAPTPAAEYSETDMSQMIEGLCTIIRDQLHHRPSEARRLYLETVIPALLAAGAMTLPELVRSAGVWFHVMIVDIADHAPPTLRSECVDWMARFSGEWCADIVRAGVGGGGGA